VKKYKLIFYLFLHLLILIVSAPSYAYSQDLLYVRYIPSYLYYQDLMVAALDTTVGEYGPYVLAPDTDAFPTLRVLREVERGKLINVFAGPALTDIVTSEIITVPIPISKGMSSYRIMIIRDGDQARFDTINTFEALKEVVLGQMYGWKDVKIYRENGFTVMDTQSFDSLIAMLLMGRIDGIPIGADLIDYFLEDYAEGISGLAIERELVMHYPFPYFFFVSENEPVLAERLQLGLESIYASGEMDEVFRRHRQKTLNKLQLSQRRVYLLNNPYLSKRVPLQHQELWQAPSLNVP